MDNIYNLTDIFDREVEILEVNSEGMIYILDQKSDSGNQCVIERYDFERRERKTLLSLDGTRLYESFRTYGVMKDYFYAVIVYPDYKLRLEEIDTHTWQLRQSFHLVPEGEVLNIYPIHPDYLIVTDEAAATDELLKRFNDEDYAEKYYTLTYLYCLKTGEKWYLQDVLEHLDVLDIQNTAAAGGSQLAFYLQEYLQSGKITDKLWTIPSDCLITEVKNGNRPVFDKIEELTEGVSLTRIKMKNRGYCYRVENRNLRRTDICELKETAGKMKKTVLSSVELPEDGSIQYDTETDGIYHISEEPDGGIRVTDLQNPERTFTYDSEYGDFGGIYMNTLAVTNFYRSETIKGDLIFREYVAVHHLDNGKIQVFRGIAEQRESYLVLLRSFLCL